MPKPYHTPVTREFGTQRKW